MPFINYTKYDIHIYSICDCIFNKEARYLIANKNAQPRNIIPTSGFARCWVTNMVTQVINGLKIYSQSYGVIEGLPAPHEGDYYIVSPAVAKAGTLLGRTDLLIPYHIVRSSEGAILGCTAFTKVV